MAVDVSRIPNNNKFDPVREAILQLQTEIEDTGATIGNGTLTISTSSPLTGSGTFTANQTGPTSISIGIDGAEYLTNITHDTVNQKLVVTYGDGTTADLSLAQYIDDTNLARLVSGSLDNQTGIATFTRDDATTFTVDLSALFDDTDTNDFLTSASFSTANGIISFGVTNQNSVTVDIDGRYPLIADLTAVSDDIITSADFSATDNRFKLTLTQADAGTIEASFDDVVLSESMAADYIPYVKVGGGDGDTTNAVLNDSFLKINGSTLELDWGDTVGVYTARDIKMRKDGGGFGTYYEATYGADSVSFLHYASASDIDTAKIGATTTGRIRINDTYSLPVGDGTSGQVLSTNGSGDLSWVAAGGPTTSDLQDVTDNGAITTNSIEVGGLTSNGEIYVVDDENTGLGIILSEGDRPLITRGWDVFTSGTYNGIGRWGMFMEPSTLVIGTPNIANNGKVAFRRFNADSTSTTTLTIDSNGFVGIATPTPSNLLHIKGSSTLMRLEGTSSYTDIVITTSANTGFLNLDNDKMNFYVGGGAVQDLKMSILKNGSVGIGNSAPSNYGGYSTLHIGSATSIGLIKLGTGATANGPEIFTNSDNDIVFNSASTGTRMTIDGTNGRVGIGATSPDATLHVKSGATTGSIRLGGGNGTGESRLYFNSDGHDSYIDSYGDSGYKDLSIQARDLYLNTNSSSGTGNVITGGYFEINKSSDKKLRFVDGRTGANTFSIEHDTSQIYFYNETNATAGLIISNSGEASNNRKFRVNSISNGSYIEISGDLPGYANNSYPVIKSGGTIHFANNNKYAAYLEGNDTYFGLINSATQTKVIIRTNGETAFNGGNVAIGAGSLNVTNGDVTSNRLYLNTSANCIFTKPDGSNYVRYLYSGANVNVVFTGGTSANSGAWGINNYEDTVRIFNILNDGTAFISNRLGIGTDSPTERLQVAEDGGIFSVNPTAGGVDLHSNGAFAPHYQTNFDWYTGAMGSGSFKMRLNSSGQLGVGSSAIYHSAKLAVAGKIHFQNSANSDIGGAIFSTWTQGANSTDYYAGDLRFQVFNASSGTYGLVDAMILDGKGFLGIGTNSPSQKLDVNGYARATSGFVGNSGLSLFGDNSSTERVFVTTGGSVGIGITSPDNKLTVRGANALVDVQSSADGQTIGFLARYQNNATLGARFIYTTGDAQAYIDNLFVGNNGVYSDINFRNCDTNGTLQSRMKIKGSSGNVGIGTESPSRKLHVVGDVYIDDDNNTGMGVVLGTGDRPLITRGWDAFTSGNKSGIGRWGVFMEAATLFIGAPGTDYANAKIVLGGYLADGTQQPTLLLNNTTRRVGINTTSPDCYLDVYQGAGGGNGTPTIKIGGFGDYPSLEFGIFNNYDGMIRTYGNDLRVYAGHWRTVGNTSSEDHSIYWFTSKSGSTDWASAKMRLDHLGKLHVANDIIAFSTGISDASLKDDVTTIDSAIDKVKALRGVSFTWNATARKGKRDIGLIAQEVEQVIPEVVHESELSVGEFDGNEKTIKTIDYDKIVGVLVEAIKEQQKQIDELKAIINGGS